MLLLEYFSCQSTPQSDQFAGANFWARGRSAAIKRVCQLGIDNSLPLSGAEKSNVHFIWKVESWSRTRMTITLCLSTFPLCPWEFWFSSTTTSKALASFTTAGATVLLAASSFWGFLVPGLAWRESGGRGRTDWETSHPILFLQVLMPKTNSHGACKYWALAIEQRYPRAGSYTMYPAVNTNQSTNLEVQVGSRSALALLSAQLWKSITPSVSLAVLGRVPAVTISNWQYLLSICIFTSIENMELI